MQHVLEQCSVFIAHCSRVSLSAVYNVHYSATRSLKCAFACVNLCICAMQYTLLYSHLIVVLYISALFEQWASAALGVG